MLLEKVGTATSDPAFASHWLTEAANVWTQALGDAHRAARALMIAIDRDPTQPTPAERLAELYREKGDTKALVALLERRAKALTALLSRDPGLREQLTTIHEELGRLWSEPPLSQPRKAIDNYRRAIDADPNNQYAIYSLRELLKAQGRWNEAIPLFEAEQRLVTDVERSIALYQDEADVRRTAGDLIGATQALRNARAQEGGQDPGLKQQVAACILERLQNGENVPQVELDEGAALFVELAEEYPGEHGFSYSVCALELVPSIDRAVQLAIYYGEQLGRVIEVAPKAAAYLRANPHGPLAADARRVVTQAMELGGDDALIEALRPPPDAPAEERIQALLDVAQALARKGKRAEAAARYFEVLALDSDNLDAIGFLEPHLRKERKLVELRDMLLAASRSEDVDVDQRKAWLKEVATLCESQLREPARAIAALQEIVALDPDDEPARSQLKRALEKAGEWDALAQVLREEAEQTADVEARISLEKALAKLHEQRRKDPIATGETWARIAALAPDDEEAILTAVRHFELGERPELAARVISDNLQSISSDATRASLLEKLGELRLAIGDQYGAGEAYAEGASLIRSEKLWAAAERAFVEASAFAQAAMAADERAELTSSASAKAALAATAADYLVRAGDEPNAVARLERATDLEPENDEYAQKLEAFYEADGRRAELANFLIQRASRLSDRATRVALRKRAADLQSGSLQDLDGARETMRAILDDGEDRDALVWLADDAEQTAEFGEAVSYLARLVQLVEEPREKLEFALREAALVAEKLDDVEGAIARYERILEDLDPHHIGALVRIADLEERRENPSGTASALEKCLGLLPDGEAKIETAERLSRLYEGPLDAPDDAVRVLDILRRLEPENYDAVQRLCELCERLGEWERVAELLGLLIEVEGDEEEVSRMTRRIAEILHQKVGKGDEALAALMQVADAGDQPCRDEYVRLGDELGWKGLVASKLVEWYAQAPIGPARNEALRGAFERFLEVGREADAASVAKELARTRGADPELATKLETIAIRLKDLDALAVAHDLLVQELSGPPRAEELVRQAEVLAEVGVDAAEAVQHGEQGLPSVPAAEAEPLLDRLARIAKEPDAVIELYERQVTRCKAPADRLQALARAAQVAARYENFERARQFFDIALSGSVQEETLLLLERAAGEGDDPDKTQRLKRTLAEALAAGGQGSRDGGRTRSALLGRAAELARRELGDVDQAFAWLGDALVAHVDENRLDALEGLAEEVGQPKRAEAVLSRALEEVFDGPLVRKLLARRAALRRNQLSDLPGAAADLKRLHDLSPSDQHVVEELSALYTELKDYRGMVTLYEDQILRGKDPATRAELARKVARLWEEQLHDPREAADAWRRVLRMKAGDPEATEGLERAKAAMLKARSSEAAKGDSAPERPAPAQKPAPRKEKEAEEATTPGTSMDMAGDQASSIAPEAEAEEREPNGGVTDPAPALAEAPAEPRVLDGDDGEAADGDSEAAADGRHPPTSEVRVPPDGPGGPGSGTRTSFATGAENLPPPARRAGGAPGAALPAAELHEEEPALDVEDDELFEDNPPR